MLPSSAATRRRRCHRTGAVSVALAVTLAGCTPISLPRAAERDDADATERLAYDPRSRRLRIGEDVPDFALIDAQGRATSLSDMGASVLVVTFYAADELGDEMLLRIRAVDDALADRLVGATRVVAVLLAPADAAPRLREDAARFAPTRSEWTFVRPADEAAAAMTGAFGIATWESGRGEIRHTLNTVVVDPRGRVADHFPGIDEWRAGDLIAAISLAAER